MPSAWGPQRANWRNLPRTPVGSPLFAGWPKTVPITRRRRPVCVIEDCINYAGPKKKTGGMCWKHWWERLK
jgi:hypothetical protein